MTEGQTKMSAAASNAAMSCRQPKRGRVLNAALYGLFPERLFSGPSPAIQRNAFGIWLNAGENIKFDLMQAAKCQQQRRIHRCIELGSLNSVIVRATKFGMYHARSLGQP